MIGQKGLEKQYNTKELPSFLLLCGPKGSGRRTFAQNLAHSREIDFVEGGTKVAEIRETLEFVKIRTEPTIYFLGDIDKMSIGAKNTILKTIEEAPNSAFFIASTVTKDGAGETIVSRSITAEMEMYTDEDKVEYMAQNGLQYSSTQNLDKLLMLSSVLPDLDKLVSYNFDEYYKFITHVHANAHSTNYGNAMKLSQYLKMKETGEGYDLALFFKSLITLSLNNVSVEHNVIGQDAMFIIAGVKALELLHKETLSKTAVFDTWLGMLRGVIE